MLHQLVLLDMLAIYQWHTLSPRVILKLLTYILLCASTAYLLNDTSPQNKLVAQQALMVQKDRQAIQLSTIQVRKNMVVV
jgi:hypothetical protein